LPQHDANFGFAALVPKRVAEKALTGHRKGGNGGGHADVIAHRFSGPI
jgi:hypothetical protein